MKYQTRGMDKTHNEYFTKNITDWKMITLANEIEPWPDNAGGLRTGLTPIMGCSDPLHRVV